MNITKSILIGLAGIVLVFGSETYLHSSINKNAGTTGMQVLKIGLGARAMGMAGAFTAVSDDVTGIYHNPSGLAGLNNMQMAFQHIMYFEDIQYANVSISNPLSIGVVGFSFSHLWMDSISGMESGTSAITKFDAKDSVITLSYSRYIEKISAGLALKIVKSIIDDNTATSYAADLSMMMKTYNNIKLAAVLQNIGTEVEYDGDDVGKVTDKLPQNLKLGCSYPLNDINIALDVNIPNDNNVYINAGMEYVLLINMFQVPIRAGYTTLNDFDSIDGLSAGLGLIYNTVSIDFAWSPYGILGDTYRTSLLLKF